MLAVGTGAQCAGTVFLYGVPFLVPALREETGLSLGAIGLLVAAPTLGMVLALLPWGVLADRRGERLVIGAGLGGAAVCLGAAGHVDDPAPLGLLFVLAGACGASVYAASGRVVVGWFPPGQRGLAMGIRQVSQPVGVALAGLALPALAVDRGIGAAVWGMAGLMLLVGALAVLVLRDTPRATPGRADAVPASPYRDAWVWRVHASAALLVAAQLAVGAFAIEYLTRAHGWTPTRAGALIAAVQLAGGAARVTAGQWSDRMGDHRAVLRRLALACASCLGLLAVTSTASSAAAVAALVLAIVTTVSWHGVGYAVAAAAVPAAWVGRALSAHTLGQNVAATATPPLFGLAVTSAGFPLAYALASLLPLAAALLLRRSPARRCTFPAWPPARRSRRPLGSRRRRGGSQRSAGAGAVASRQPLDDQVGGALDRVGDQSPGDAGARPE
jgi:nitrate/nitrite transporter NarK